MNLPIIPIKIDSSYTKLLIIDLINFEINKLPLSLHKKYSITLLMVDVIKKGGEIRLADALATFPPNGKVLTPNPEVSGKL